jgi:hypothetical protein
VGIWHNFWSQPGCLLGQHVSVDMVTVGRETDGLQFSGLQRGPDGEIWDVWVHLRVAGLDASMRVFLHYANGFDELGGFFRGLAADWRGWPGERTYESIEHELRLTATHNGHVRLAVQLCQSSLPDRYGWSASGVFRLDPGEEMTRAAENLPDLLSTPRSAPEV